jgi:hypothetical protein
LLRAGNESVALDFVRSLYKTLDKAACQSIIGQYISGEIASREAIDALNLAGRLPRGPESFDLESTSAHCGRLHHECARRGNYQA